MFGALKSMWNDAGVTASVDGVLREAGNGNAVEVQKWYFKLKKTAHAQAKKLGITPDEAEQRALATVDPVKLAQYQGIVLKLTRPGGVLAEIDTWLENNEPV